MKYSKCVMMGLLAMGLCLTACQHTSKNTTQASGDTPNRPGSKLRVGTFDSRTVAGAYYGSEEFDRHLKDLSAEHERAKAAGDEKRVKELEVEGPASQELAHKQFFGTGSVDNILEKIKAKIPRIAKQAGVDVIVSKYDVVYQQSGVEFVDVTDYLVKLFPPKNKAESGRRE